MIDGYNTVRLIEVSSECVSMHLPLAAHPILILLNYFLSGMDVRGKGFHEVVLALLRLTPISDILSDAKEGSLFFLFP